MKLIKYENYTISPTEECFYVKELREIFNKDKSATKETFMQTISYIYFFADPRSSYQDIIDDEERSETIIKEQAINKIDVNDSKIQKAIGVYIKLTTTTSQKLLDSMRKSVAKIGEFLENVDLYATDDKGKRIDSVSTIVSATDKIPNLAKKLIETEKIVESEITEVGRARGGNESKKVFEDGFHFK